MGLDATPAVTTTQIVALHAAACRPFHAHDRPAPLPAQAPRPVHLCRRETSRCAACFAGLGLHEGSQLSSLACSPEARRETQGPLSGQVVVYEDTALLGSVPDALRSSPRCACSACAGLTECMPASLGRAVQQQCAVWACGAAGPDRAQPCTCFARLCVALTACGTGISHSSSLHLSSQVFD